VCPSLSSDKIDLDTHYSCSNWLIYEFEPKLETAANGWIDHDPCHSELRLRLDLKRGSVRIRSTTPRSQQSRPITSVLSVSLCFSCRCLAAYPGWTEVGHSCEDL
jgi:hypothetical protein